MDLCGHATLASAHALYSTGRTDSHLPINFHSLKSGVLIAQSPAPTLYTLDFPSTPAAALSSSADLTSARGTESGPELEILLQAFPHLTEMDILFMGRSPYDLLVEVTPAYFARLHAPSVSAAIRFDRISQLGGRGVLLTAVGDAARASYAATLTDSPQQKGFSRESIMEGEGEQSVVLDGRFHFLSRCFFPVCGINEDPVTGSAHCALTPHWTSRLLSLGFGPSLHGFQASQRGGLVIVELKAGEAGDRVTLTGPCITTIESKLLV